jgi:hypothetical protein
MRLAPATVGTTFVTRGASKSTGAPSAENKNRGHEVSRGDRVVKEQFFGLRSGRDTGFEK